MQMIKELIKLSPREDAAVTKAARSDADARPLTDRQWIKVKPSLKRPPGRPLGSGTKEQVTLRIDSDTLAFYKSKGQGWQTLINTLLGEIKKDSKSIKQIEKKVSSGKLFLRQPTQA